MDEGFRSLTSNDAALATVAPVSDMMRRIELMFDRHAERFGYDERLPQIAPGVAVVEPEPEPRGFRVATIHRVARCYAYHKKFGKTMADAAETWKIPASEVYAYGRRIQSQQRRAEREQQRAG